MSHDETNGNVWKQKRFNDYYNVLYVIEVVCVKILTKTSKIKWGLFLFSDIYNCPKINYTR